MSQLDRLSPDLRPRFERCVDLYRGGAFDDAEQSLGVLLESAPEYVDALHLLGVIAARTGRSVQAVDLLARSIALEPSAAPAHRTLGRVLLTLERHAEAVASFDAALALGPPIAEVHLSRALALKALNRPEAALADISAALALRPDSAAAHNECGNVLCSLGRDPDAIEGFTRAIALAPGAPEPYINRAAALQRLRRFEQALHDSEAAAALDATRSGPQLGRAVALRELKRGAEALNAVDRALALSPQESSLHNIRGSILLDLHRPEDALESFDAALALDPRHAHASVNRAAALRALHRFEEALSAANQAIAAAPSNALAHAARAAALVDLRHPQQALTAAETAQHLDPSLWVARVNRAAALCDLERYEDALDCCDAALSADPAVVEAHVARGSVLLALRDPRAALGALNRARTLAPGSAAADYHAAQVHLQGGDFECGWPLYEARLAPGGSVAVRSLTQPLWRGEQPLAGKRLFIHAEQGLGDTLQFCRYAKLAVAAGARVWLAAHDPLRAVLAGLHENIEILRFAEQPAEFDWHIPLLSLPLAFATTVATIPAEVSYLHAEPARVQRWRAALGPAGFRVGIAWQGSTRRVDVGRSFALCHLQGVASIPGVRLISLQKGAGEEQLEQLPDGMTVERLAPDFDRDGAFLDAAAVIQACDLVITSDTAIAHLAGALGMPTWVALKHSPDWRWMLERSDSPWYPAHRLFRQQRRGDWPGVFAAMAAALADRVADARR